MPVQTHLFPEPPEPTPGPALEPGASSAFKLAPVWLQRLSLFILVLFCIYLGVLVAVLPWLGLIPFLPNPWDHNLFFLAHPRLWAVLRLGPVRGIITGFGLLDIWIGISEAIHYRDQREETS